MKKLSSLTAVILLCTLSAQAQFIVTPTTNYTMLIDSFILTGVTASNVQYTGAPNTVGSFTNGGITNLGMTDGIAMTTGCITATPSIGSPVSSFASTSNGVAGYPLLDSLIPGYTTYDASVLEFDLVPVGNVLEFQYVFASEEYPEYVGSAYNDVFGFFISGPDPQGGNFDNVNIAKIPFSSDPVSINNVNANLNSAYFVDNQALGGVSIVFDGFTTVLAAKLFVIPSSTYHLIMSIADAGDGIYDSGIFLRASSMKSYTSATGVDEHTSTPLQVFPSIADDRIQIKTGKNAQVEIYTAQGAIVKTFQANDETSILNISDLSEGAYWVKSVSEGGVSTQKFIKK